MWETTPKAAGEEVAGPSFAALKGVCVEGPSEYFVPRLGAIQRENPRRRESPFWPMGEQWDQGWAMTLLRHGRLNKGSRRCLFMVCIVTDGATWTAYGNMKEQAWRRPKWEPSGVFQEVGGRSSC